MGNLEGLFNRTKVDFPRQVDRKETIEILKYICKNLPAVVSGQYDTHFTFRNKGTTDNVSENQYIMKFTGQISAKLAEDYSSVTFSLPSHTTLDFDTVGVNSIKELEALPSGKLQLQLMDTVRGCVEQYFVENPGQ